MSVDRLKPAFGFADPAPVISVPKEGRTTGRKTMPKAAKKSLNPAAEVFVPGAGTGESSSTATRSRFGCVSRPPERLGI